MNETSNKSTQILLELIQLSEINILNSETISQEKMFQELEKQLFKEGN